ncbi:MAG TPA: CinA family nicotinamide mononucleotide deamidase-related protein [Chitinophagaceae bacterium]|nr:CinA family nicotinamide mononucleotide deamidase-related protein [Chitinophagaceae bacterium]
MTHCSIITIGDELLFGLTTDTNSSWMASELNQAGFRVIRRIAVGDDPDAIIMALKDESLRSEIILVTGGLGPTSDDITREVLCVFFGDSLVMNEPLKKRIEMHFESLGLPILESNLRQAMVPKTCNMIPNEQGTAPGIWFDRDGRVYVAMPGVPHEMEEMMIREVIPRLRKRFIPSEIIHRTLITTGQGESFVAERLKGFEKQLPEEIKLAYLPSYGFLKLRLTGLGSKKSSLQIRMEEHFARLIGILNDIILAQEDISIGEIAGRMLKQQAATVGTAESCTGGYIAHLLTQIPGSSAYFRGGVISYADELKTDLLGVDNRIIRNQGAVSEDTVKAMAKGALIKLKTDYILAVTGIMGPGGGTLEKPVGTLWIAAANREKVLTRCYQLKYDRKNNIRIASFHALKQLISLLNDIHPPGK